jgi:hypothetical protein
LKTSNCLCSLPRKEETRVAHFLKNLPTIFYQL